jgi:hypothetical protein
MPRGEAGLVAAALPGFVHTAQPGRVRVNCPLCELRTGKADRKRSMSIETQHGYYKCFKCGALGTLPDFDMPPEDEPAHAALAPLEGAKEVEPPEGWVPLWKGAAARSDAARAAVAYALRRCSRALWEQLQIGATLSGDGMEAGRVVVPVIDPAGCWVGWVGRLWRDGGRLPYYTCPGMERARVLFNAAALAEETDRPLLVVEGVFDAIHLYPDAVAVLGKPSAEQEAALAASPRPVVYVLDGDAWEEAEGLALRLALRRGEGAARVGHVPLPAGVDPDEIPADELKRLAVASLEEKKRW